MNTLRGSTETGSEAVVDRIDFRSQDGLYRMSTAQARAENLPTNIMALLSALSLKDSTKRSELNRFIYDFFAEAVTAEATRAHKMIQMMHSCKILLRYYTQNIDGIDDQLGIPRVDHAADPNGNEGQFVQLHGSVRWLKCTLCNWGEPLSNLWADKMRKTGSVLHCPVCPTETRSGRPTKPGIVRTAVVLYDEEHVYGHSISNCFDQDISQKPDLLLVMGTSLSSIRSNSLIQLVSKISTAVHQSANGLSIFMNTAPPPPRTTRFFDYHLAGNLEDWSSVILRKVSLLLSATACWLDSCRNFAN
ncbi:hypothetical protein RSAG8_07212, partial [Rhizoctonia solani AG-8 WAC10335]